MLACWHIRWQIAVKYKDRVQAAIGVLRSVNKLHYDTVGTVTVRRVCISTQLYMHRAICNRLN
jgi:hypothetical protein